MASYGQQAHLNVFNGISEDVRGQLDVAGFCRQSAVQPMLIKETLPFYHFDSLTGKLGTQKKCILKLLQSHSLDINNKNIHFELDPIFDLQGGLGTRGLKLFGGGDLGLNITVDFGKHISIGGYGRINQFSFPDYFDEIVHSNRVVPGSGYAVKSSIGGHYFWDWDVYANVDFLKYFNLETGMGRNFWGDGYRTFFLSDNSFSYPYIKITTSVWKIKYVNLYTQLKDMQNTGSGLYRNMENKYGSFHFLSWDVSKRVNIGFFEAIIWQQEDSSANRGFDVNYINPVIFFRPVEFSIGSPDNSLMGFSMKVKVAKKNFFYGQFLLDDIIFGEFTKGSLNRLKKWFGNNDSTLQYGYWTNKQAWQLGFSSYDLFKVKNLDIQIEYNAARPYTFSHRRPIVNYSNYNEPLAHPAGANFTEVLGFLRYRTGRWFFEGQLMYLVTGLDSVGTHFGQNIFQSTFDTYYPEINNIPVQQYGNNITQGIKTRILYAAVRAAWLVNPSMNLRIETEIAWRKQSSALNSASGLYISAGIKTSWYSRRMDR